MRIIEKHSLWLRVHHWLNFPLLILMIWSGLLIYWANDIYPGFFPNRFYDLLGIPSRLAEGLSTHFFIGWLFVFNGLGYILYLFSSGHWRELFPNLNSLMAVPATLLHDFGLRTEAPPQGKFNAVQRLAYTGALALAAVGVLSGFALYKPVQLSWLLWFFYDYRTARLVHFAVLLAFTAFFCVHLLQVARAGWNGFRAMIAGFEVEDEHK